VERCSASDGSHRSDRTRRRSHDAAPLAHGAGNETRHPDGTRRSRKTRLALELARWIAGEGVTRVLLVPLAAVRDPAFVALRIAEAIGLSDVTALRSE